MRVRSVSVSSELLILKACVTDRLTLSRMAQLEDSVEFKTKYGRLVFAWCLKYFDEYDAAPGKEYLQHCFLKWSERNDDDKTALRLEDFLTQVDDVEVNGDYVGDRIGEYFTGVSLEALSDELADTVAQGDTHAARELVAKWRPVEVGTDASVDVLRDAEALREAFERRAESLIDYPGGLGKFFGSTLARDSFVAFMGPEKRGKTFWLMDIAWRAMLAKRRVAFFGLGDMSQPQYMHRFAIRAAKRPSHACELPIPTSIKWEQDKEGRSYEIETRIKRYDGNLGWRDAWKACEKIVNHSGSSQPMLRLSAHPNSTMGVSNIETQLDLWEKGGWVPDVIVLDYADLLMHPRGATDERDASNTNWKQLRKISQERHNLVVTATQASAGSYDSYLVTKQHFSEDKRKLAHVTAMIGLNQTDQEKNDGVMRLNYIVRRDAHFTEYHCCLTAGRREVGNLAIKSHF